MDKNAPWSRFKQGGASSEMAAKVSISKADLFIAESRDFVKIQSVQAWPHIYSCVLL